jgi:hypothetical protein
VPLWNWLISSDMGCPGPAGRWPHWLSFAFHISNLVIALADLAIPVIILANWKYKREGIARRAIWTVLLYFPVKAASRLVRVLELLGPLYHLAVIFDVLTAALAVYAGMQLGPFLRHVLKLPSRDEVHKLNQSLQNKALEVQVLHLEEKERNARLLAEIGRLKRAPPDPSERSWLAAKHNALDRIAEVIKQGA